MAKRSTSLTSVAPGPTSDRRRAPVRFALRPSRSWSARALSALALTKTATPVDLAMTEHDRMRREIAKAMAELLNRWLDEPNDIKRSALREKFDALAERQTTLMAIAVESIRDEPRMAAALEKLQKANAALQLAVEELRRAVDAIKKVASVLAFADKAIELLRKLPSGRA